MTKPDVFESPINDLFSMTDRTVLITGGTTGLGLMMARALASAGAQVLVTSRSSQLPAQGNLAPGTIEHIGCFDLACEPAWESLRETLAARVDRLDVLINNAGAYDTAGFRDAQPETFQALFDANVKSAMFISQALVPLLRAAAQTSGRARIINIGSVVGRLPLDSPSYSISKSALHHLTRIMAKTLAGDGINVNAIAPGSFRTDMTAAQLDALGSEFVERFPAGRIGQESDIQGAILFLSAKAGEFVTGHILALDGGFADLIG